nr:no significant similarity found [uncultured bacterium]
MTTFVLRRTKLRREALFLNTLKKQQENNCKMLKNQRDVKKK